MRAQWLAIGLLMMLVDPAAVCAQGRRQAYAPSLMPPSAQMLHRFGRIGGWLSPQQSVNDARRQAVGARQPTQMPSADSWSAGTGYGSGYRPGYGSSGGQALGGAALGGTAVAGGLQSGAGAMTGGISRTAQSLLAPSRMLWPRLRNQDSSQFMNRPLRPSQFLTQLQKAEYTAGYSPIGRVRTTLGRRDRLVKANYLDMVQPGVLAGAAAGGMMAGPTGPAVVARARGPATGGSGGESAPTAESSTAKPAPAEAGRQRSLEELVGEYVVAQTRSLLAAGWAAFKEGQYIRALELFRAADAAASAGDPRERSAIRLAAVYAALAAGQLTQAALELGWILDDRLYSPGVPRDPLVFNRLGVGSGIDAQDIRPFYGVPAQIQEHTQRIDMTVTQNPQAPELRALKAVWMWGLGDRRGAIFEARQIRRGPRDVVAFDRLAAFLEAAMARRQTQGQAAPAAEAPWPEFVESVMRRVSPTTRPE